MNGDEACGRTFRSGSGRYYDCERGSGHDGRHSAFPDVAPTAPAPGGGRTRDAREQIARAVSEWETFTADDGYPSIRQREPRSPEEIADAVLTCPVVADALAAVERVRAFVDGFAERGGGNLDPGDELWIMSIRRALDGDP